MGILPASGTSPPVTATAVLTERDLKKIRAAGLDFFDRTGQSQGDTKLASANLPSPTLPVHPDQNIASSKPN
jgi:serine kinase of HPr protein (carbohydrate metabolism regulator)